MLYCRILTVLGLLFFSVDITHAIEPLSVGVTRWDSWTKTWPDNQFNAFIPAKYHYRLPFYAYHNSDGTIEMSEDKQSVINREILYAKKGGINYFNFSWYEPASLRTPVSTSGFVNALHLYLSSPYRSKVNFTLMFMGPGHMGTSADWESVTVPKFLSYMNRIDVKYHTVLGGRPVIYFFEPEKLIYLFPVTGVAEVTDEMRVQAVKAKLNHLKSEVRKVRGVDPYLVGNTFRYDAASLQKTKAMGFDATGSYLTGGSGCAIKPCPYSNISNYVRYFSESQKNSILNLVTPGTVGLNDNPRWEWRIATGRSSANPSVQGTTYQDATESELTTMMTQQKNWTITHPVSNPAQTMLVYAWNEFAEGGWLVPGLYEGEKNLRGFAKGLGIAYPPPLSGSVTQNGNTLTLTVTGQLPANPYIQLFDRGSAYWGSRIAMTKVNAGTATVSLPSVPPPSQCNRGTECTMNADIFEGTSDVPYFVKYKLPKAEASTVPGDFTGDGKVDLFDYNKIIAGFGNPYTIFDYNTLIANYGK